MLKFHEENQKVFDFYILVEKEKETYNVNVLFPKNQEIPEIAKNIQLFCYPNDRVNAKEEYKFSLCFTDSSKKQTFIFINQKGNKSFCLLTQYYHPDYFYEITAQISNCKEEEIVELCFIHHNSTILHDKNDWTISWSKTNPAKARFQSLNHNFSQISPSCELSKLYQFIFNKLPIQYILSIIVAMTLDCRIVVISSDLSTISNMIFSLLALIYPLNWPGTLIPILPSSILTMLDAPFAYIIGIHSSNSASLISIESYFVINVDFHYCANIGLDDFPSDVMKYIDVKSDELKKLIARYSPVFPFMQVQKFIRMFIRDLFGVAYNLEKTDDFNLISKNFDQWKSIPSDDFKAIFSQTQFINSFINEIVYEGNHKISDAFWPGYTCVKFEAFPNLGAPQKLENPIVQKEPALKRNRGNSITAKDLKFLPPPDLFNQNEENKSDAVNISDTDSKSETLNQSDADNKSDKTNKSDADSKSDKINKSDADSKNNSLAESARSTRKSISHHHHSHSSRRRRKGKNADSVQLSSFNIADAAKDDFAAFKNTTKNKRHSSITRRSQSVETKIPIAQDADVQPSKLMISVNQNQRRREFLSQASDLYSSDDSYEMELPPPPKKPPPNIPIPLKKTSSAFTEIDKKNQAARKVVCNPSDNLFQSVRPNIMKLNPSNSDHRNIKDDSDIQHTKKKHHSKRSSSTSLNSSPGKKSNNSDDDKSYLKGNMSDSEFFKPQISKRRNTDFPDNINEQDDTSGETQSILLPNNNKKNNYNFPRRPNLGKTLPEGLKRAENKRGINSNGIPPKIRPSDSTPININKIRHSCSITVNNNADDNRENPIPSKAKSRNSATYNRNSKGTPIPSKYRQNNSTNNRNGEDGEIPSKASDNNNDDSKQQRNIQPNANRNKYSQKPISLPPSKRKSNSDAQKLASLAIVDYEEEEEEEEEKHQANFIKTRPSIGSLDRINRGPPLQAKRTNPYPFKQLSPRFRPPYQTSPRGSEESEKKAAQTNEISPSQKIKRNIPVSDGYSDYYSDYDDEKVEPKVPVSMPKSSTKKVVINKLNLPLQTNTSKPNSPRNFLSPSAGASPRVNTGRPNMNYRRPITQTRKKPSLDLSSSSEYSD